MDARSLIDHDFPVLGLEDSGKKALSLMHEYRVFHLPLVQRDSYLALISEDDLLDWDTPEEPLSLAEFLHFRPAISETAHPYEVAKMAAELQLSVVPVLDKQHHFAGIITLDHIFQYLTLTQGIRQNGAILVLEMAYLNYSLTEISRICESNDIRILKVDISPMDEQGMMQVILKVNQHDLQALVSTFERFNYQVVETHSTEYTQEDVQHNYDMLMYYINL